MEFRDLKKQYMGLEEKINESIAGVLSSAQFISGQEVRELEESLEEYVGVKHCITCGNGTDAITLGLMAWDVGPGDAVFVPDFTFFSTGESPASLGASVVFVDVEHDSYNIDPDKLEEEIIRVENEGALTPKVVIAVDLFGLPADYKKLKAICDKHNLYLLEDGAQGFGGKIDERRACSFGDISTTSFFPAKPLGCYGDGGAVFTDNKEWADKIRSTAVHGKSGNNKYENVRLGMNSRLDTIQAAILKVKLQAFEEFELQSVNDIAIQYTEKLKKLDVVVPMVKEGYLSSWAQYTIKLPSVYARDDVQSKLKERDVPTMVYYAKPLHLQKAFAESRNYAGDCSVSEALCRCVLSLPMHPYMTYDMVEYVVDCLGNIIRKK